MATYSTRALAAEILPDALEQNAKAATRTLRKFLRDELGEGKAVVGKGNRYALELNKREITAMRKKFAAWEIAQAEAQKARREALAAKITPAADDSAPESDIDDNDDTALEGPTDEEIAEILCTADDED